MKPYLIFAAAVLFASSELVAQDTTGGTRPTVIIPLHKTKKTTIKKTLPQDQPPVLNNTESPKAPINADERKLKRAKKKSSRKP